MLFLKYRGNKICFCFFYFIKIDYLEFFLLCLELIDCFCGVFCIICLIKDVFLGYIVLIKV